MGVKAGYKQTEVGVIPASWTVKRLDELGKWKGGMTPSMQNPDFWVDGTVPWISSGDVKTAHLTETIKCITPDAVEQNTTTMLPAGSIVLVTRSGILRKYLPVAINVVPMAINQDIKALVPTAHTSAPFVLHALTESGPRILSRCMKAGTTVESVEFKWLKAYELAIPPLPEQQAIANALSDVDQLIASLDQLIAKKRDLKQAAMQQLLSGKTRFQGFSGEWLLSPLSKAAWYQEGPGVRNTQFTTSGVKLLNGTNIVSGVLRLENTTRFISEQEAFGAYAHFLADEGDIVVASSGITIDRLDEKVAVVRSIDLPFCMNTSTIRFKPKQELLLSAYLYQYLASEFFKKSIGGYATGSAQLNYGPSHLNKIDLFLPSIAEQEVIAATLYDMDSELTELEQRRDKTVAVKQGMMQELLTGRTRLV